MQINKTANQTVIDAADNAFKGKRTGLDFSKHEVFVSQQKGVLIHHIKKPGTIHDNIKFINTNGIMAVTGDYGNWIFCREFHPSIDGFVESGYWKEKLGIASTQQSSDYDSDGTRERLQEELDGGLEEYGYIGPKLQQMKEYIEGCLQNVDDELDYLNFAHRELPWFCDHEQVIVVKITKPWLQCVFDGFDEICRRMKAGEIFKPIE